MNDPFQALVERYELKPHVSKNLYEVLTKCKIVLLCDDSSSMNSKIVEPNGDPFANNTKTRWLELKKLAAVMIEIITSTNPEGLDIHFLNRDSKLNVTTMDGLQALFAHPPKGSTPLVSALGKIYNQYINYLDNKQLLIVVITDGEPTDGTRRQLFNRLTNITQNGNIHISFAECTDKEEDMEYLDQWDGKIRNFDNTDDYREELERVKRVNGNNFKFDYTDYVIKILLATFVKWYYNLDQVNGSIYRGNNQGCCMIL